MLHQAQTFRRMPLSCGLRLASCFPLSDGQFCETIRFLGTMTGNSLTRKIDRRNRRCVFKRGTAMVETAILMPLLVLVTFGALELSNMIFLKQSLSIASYEGAKRATSPGVSESQIRSRVQEILGSRGITNATIAVTPTITSATVRGTMVVVSVSSNGGGVGFLSVNIFTPTTLQNHTAMVRQ